LSPIASQVKETLSPTLSVVVGVTVKERMRGSVVVVGVGDGGSVGFGIAVAG
jgi:hypothetical protein